MRKLINKLIEWYINSILSTRKKQEFSYCPPYINKNGNLMFTGNILKDNGCIEYRATGKILGIKKVPIAKNNSVLGYNVQLEKKIEK